MKIALLSNDKTQFDRVYTDDNLKELAKRGELSNIISSKNIEENKDFLKECEVAFTTWGVPIFTSEQIKKYMPNLKAVFYAAGSVQHFAKPYLENGIRVFSAFAANAVPVAEYTFAQISLATKGYFQSAKLYKLNRGTAYVHSNTSPGNFHAKIGIVGLGAIGSMIAEKLKALDVNVYAYDPFVSKEKADKLNVTLVSLEEIFKECDVISNHLANKKELNDIFNKDLFKLMKKRSVFINTGRGAQVNEGDLARSLLAHPSRTALIDVIKNEKVPCFSPLYWCRNAIITPHIAGSSGQEPQRMAYYMFDELDRYINNEASCYEVTLEMLKTMA